MAGLGDLVQRATPSGRDVGYQPRQDKPIPDIASAHKGRAMTDSEFQEFPGTPPMGRQVSVGIGVDWQ